MTVHDEQLRHAPEPQSADGAYRYPFGPYPTGWYLVTESASLEAGGVQPLRLFGRDLVLFRTAGGTAVLLDAHCPHMGAHLGYGGSVEEEGLRCPFHQWRFDTAGHCDDVPYGTGRVPEVRVHCWPTHETSGLILVHYSEHGRPPTWSMPDLPEWEQPGWVGYTSVGWRIRMHVQEVAENVPDTAHFLYVHTVEPMPVAVISTDGHIYRQQTRIAETDHTVTSQEAFGLGLIWLRNASPLPMTFLTAMTPVDDQYVDLRLLFLVHEGEGATELSPLGRMMIDSIAENTSRDVPIWEHKVYRERPPLVAGDGPIAVLRKWARQFYEVGAAR